MIIRSEIEKFKTEQCYINQKGAAILPTKAMFMEHIAADKTLKPVSNAVPLMYCSSNSSNVIVLSSDIILILSYGYFESCRTSANDILKLLDAEAIVFSFFMPAFLL